MKIFFRTIHLYLSLLAGLFIIISCLTGAILVFEEELEHTIHKNRYYVEAGSARLPLNAIVENAIGKVPQGKLSSLKVYSDPTRAVEVGIQMAEDNKEGKGRDERNNADKSAKKSPAIQADTTNVQKDGKENGKGPGKGKPNLTAFANPYTGEILEIFDRKKSFFFQVESLHRWLLTGPDGIGKLIMGISASIFFFILITGIVLWWPKNKKILTHRLKIKFGGSFKRLNHDLHIVTGFYTSVFLIVIVLSGLVFSFKWMNNGIFVLTGSKMENPEPPASVYQKDAQPIPVDDIYRIITSETKTARHYVIRIPKDSAGAFAVSVLPFDVADVASETYHLDQFSGKILAVQRFEDKNTGQKIRAYVKPVHTGAVFGITSKVISLLICLITLTFPVTGIIMWLNRHKKKKKKKARSLIVEEKVVSI